MTNEQKARELAEKHEIIYENLKRECLSDYPALLDTALEMAEWKDEQINLLLDAIDYAYLKTDGTYGDLALVVADKVEYLKSLRHGKIE